MVEVLKREKFNIIGKIKALKSLGGHKEDIKILQKRTRQIDKEVKKCLNG